MWAVRLFGGAVAAGTPGYLYKSRKFVSIYAKSYASTFAP